MQRFHIVYFLDYGQYYGGAANTLLQQAILVKRAGQKVTIIISNYLKDDIEEGYLNICLNNNITLLELTYPICSHTEDIDIVSVIQNYDSVKTKIKELHPDILHSIQINPIVELVSRELGIPHIMNIYQISSNFFSINYMDIFPHFHICDSWYYAKEWEYYLGTESVCIRTIAQEVKKMKRNDKKNKKHFNYMCVGTVCKRKNQFGIIKAFHKALQYGIKGELSIYGYYEGDYANKCRDYIRAHKLENDIVLKGFNSNMEEEYRKNDVLICGSIMESYPNVISEALANEMIIISTPVAGVPEVIKDHYNGYLCKGFTENDIFDKLVELNNEKFSLSMNEILKHTYETFKTFHSDETIKNQLLEYYKVIAKRKYESRDILINDVIEKFEDIIAVYEKNLPIFMDKTAVRQKLWYIYHIKDILNNKALNDKKQVFIWGTGKYGEIVKQMLDAFWKGIPLHGYIDSYKTGLFQGYKIFSPKDVIKNEKSLIIIGAVNGQEEMIRQLEDEKKVYNSDYFLLSPRVW